MKKMLRRISALVCIVTLFAAPATAFAASEPVLSFSYDENPEYQFKIFKFVPEPYFLSGSQAIALILRDVTTSDGLWNTPEGLTFRVDIIFSGPCTFRLLVARMGYGTVLDETVTGSSCYFDIPSISSNAEYQVWILPYSDVYIETYTFLNHNF